MGQAKMKKKLLKNLIENNSNCYFGVDFGGSCLRLLQISGCNENLNISGWSEKKIPRGIMDQGKIDKKEEFIEIFQETLENVKGEFFGDNIMLTIPEEKVFTRVIEVPVVNKNESSLEDSIRWETEASMPVSISEIYYDWQIIKKKPEKTSVLVMAVDKSIVDNYLEVFDKLNLNVIAMEPESLSMARSVIDFNFKGYSLLVDIGDHSSNLIICRNNLPVFTSSSSISSKMITDLIVRRYGFSFEKAERYKLKVGLEGQSVELKKEKSVFKPVLQALVSEIEKMSEFLDSNLFLGEKDKSINKIILCGGGSNLKGLVSYLTVKLKKPVIQSNPWINFNFNKKIPPISKQNSQSFTPVIGLTLKFEDYEKNN